MKSKEKQKPMFLVIDTETTGLHPSRGDKIVSIGLLLTDTDFNELVAHEFVVNPGRDIPIEASKIHGIYTDDIKDVKRTMKDVEPTLDAFCESASVIFFHNSEYDTKMIGNELPAMNRHWNKAWCTMKNTAKLLSLPGGKVYGAGKWPKLDELARFCGCPDVLREQTRQHGALDDCRLTAKCLKVLGEKHQEVMPLAYVLALSGIR